MNRYYFKLLGKPLTSSEIHFFNAYRLHAKRFGIITDINLNEIAELETHWGFVYTEFLAEWPEIADRFA
jgi:hypothetical protein